MKALLLVVLLAGIPGAALAQASIAGAVTDQSDTPIPGVIVEAISPVLIEKARTAVTDGNGQYRIEDLRPGVYRVTFTLAGWRPYQQDEVELRGSLTTSVNAKLVLGPLTESITVTGNVPVVDVHGVKHEVSLTGEVVKSIPTVRSYNALLVLVLGVVTNVNDTVTGTATTSFPIHGGRQNEGRLSLDGLTVGSPPQGNSATSYVVDAGNAAEVTFTTAGALGETETAGLVMNIVPRNGSNTTQGSFFVSGTGAKLQSDNLTQELKAQGGGGYSAHQGLRCVGCDRRPDREGPRLVFRQRARRRQHDEGPNVYYNLNAGDPNSWLYAPDLERLSYSDRTFENASGLVTWQVTPRHRISGFWDAQALCRTCTGARHERGTRPSVAEAVGVLGRRLDVSQAAWSWPITNRLLLDAGFGGTVFGFGNAERDPTRRAI